MMKSLLMGNVYQLWRVKNCLDSHAHGQVWHGPSHD
jgi:hypothetical protein